MFKDFKFSDLEDRLQEEKFKNSAKELEEIIEQNKKKLEKLLEIGEKSYENFVVPYQQMAEELEQFCTPIFHLDSVKNSELTQKVYDECLPLISIYSSQLSSNEDVYTSFKDIQYKYNSTLSIEQQKVLENEIRDFKLGGCGLSDIQKQELEKLNLEMSELGKKFSQNLLNATNAWEMILEEYEDVKEIPKSDLEAAKFTDEDGKEKYKFTLQMPSYIAYITYGSNRTRREEIYKAYCTRAPENSKLIERILELRKQEAELLGFKNFAELSLATKMANTEDEVVEFLYELAKHAKPKAKEELEEVRAFAKEFDGLDDLQSYDTAYYSQKLKEKQYDIDDEYYRPYFEKRTVLKGLFDFLKRVFGIEFTKVDVDVWDPKAEAYEIKEEGKAIARLYVDLEARKDKRGGAWMNNWHTHSKIDGKEELATAYIVCNFPTSSETSPSLLRHDDVTTLFHEMGHALHHMLSKVEQPFVSGINGVAWDTVEFPSQFLEYFAYDKEVLQMFAIHYQTHKVLDDEAIEKLIRARNFQSSLSTLRQVEFALFDFKLHQNLYKEDEVQPLLDSIRDEIAVMLPPAYNRFQNGFSHIFAGGYAAGYYSYKWAEVLSADAFYMFIENGVLNEHLARKYKDIVLGKGGSVDMNILFKDFTDGKEPDVKSLLKIDGIIS